MKRFVDLVLSLFVALLLVAGLAGLASAHGGGGFTVRGTPFRPHRGPTVRSFGGYSYGYGVNGFHARSFGPAGFAPFGVYGGCGAGVNGFGVNGFGVGGYSTIQTFDAFGNAIIIYR